MTRPTRESGHFIYKVCSETEWNKACATGKFCGNSDDLCDGFIHFSTAEQLSGTLAKHFTGREDLVLICVDATKLGAALRWEPARNGQLFPHLYDDLATEAAIWIVPLHLDRYGRHRLPEKLNIRDE